MSGLRSSLRWLWAQLTSMRTALALLFCLALASIPGSIVPQESISAIEVADFKAQYPNWDRVLEPLGMYEVYSSVWFSAIYLLLFISLIGCILPRIAKYWRTATSPPPRLPARPERLPVARTTTLTGDPAEVLDRAEGWLRKHRYRINRTPEGISAERGYLREAGNLVFHIGLVVLLVGLAWSSLLGFRGTAMVVEQRAFSNVITQYDDYSAGAWVNDDNLEPFTIELESFDVEFETGDVQRGAPRRFDAQVNVTEGDTQTDALIQVNQPYITAGGSQVSLLGHGYAPIITVTDGNGDLAYSGPVIFLPQDGNFASVGVVKVPDARPDRLAFEGFFFPTAVMDDDGPRSAFPAALNPELYLNVWAGDPATETGEPENVFVLNTTGLTPVTGEGAEPLRLRLQPGTGTDLPDGLGSVTFEGYSRWVQFQISQTPGNPLTLGALIVAVAGLCVSLTIRPRRLFVRITADKVVTAGLDRSDPATGLDQEVAQLAGSLGDGTSDRDDDQAQWAAGDVEQRPEEDQ